MSVDSPEELIHRLREIAKGYVLMGPGYAQEGVVLREAKEKIRPTSLAEEQLILEAWQRLFIEGDFAWGYNLDNPSSPFFHSVSQRVSVKAGGR